MPSKSSSSADFPSLLWPILAGFVFGCAWQLQQAALWHGPVYAGLALMGAASLWCFGAVRTPLRASTVTTLGVAIAAVALGFGGAGLRASSFLAEGLNPLLEGRDMRVTGVVSAMPQRNEAGLRFLLALESAQLDGRAVKLPPKLMLSWYAGFGGGFDAGNMMAELQQQPADLRAGERWQMTVRLKAPHGNSNPYGFDYELWLWEQGVQATGYVRAGTLDVAPQRLGPTWRHPVEAMRQSVRDAIFERVPDRQQAGLIAALVVGDQNAIDRADWDVFRATGVAHLMSISGVHITMFAWAAVWLVGSLWRRSARLCLAYPAPSAALVGGIVLASAYAIFSGWGVPSQRTIWMLCTVGLLKLSGRTWPWPQVWLLAMAVIVAVDPWALLQAGFWLSFVAVGVLFATDSGDGDVASQGVQTHAQSLFREQWVVTMALTPLSLLLFNQVSVVGLLANALAIPWVTLVLTPLAMLGVPWAPLWDAAAWAVAGMTWVLQCLAALPFATLSVAAAPLWAAAAGVAGGALLVMPWPRRVRALGAPLLLPVLLWQSPRPELGQFELLAADIGQGNAVLVRTANHALVYDAGPRFSRESDAGHRVLVPLLKALGERVDTLVLSHRDTDHTGGAAAVLATQPKAQLLSSIADDHFLQTLRPAQRCQAGQRWDWDGVRFEVLHPLATDYEAQRKSNAMSCVLRVTNGVHTVLLVGDVEQAQEAQLLANDNILKADVLLVPHHGSKTSSSGAFLDAVAPRFALVQSGYRNRFGHPAAAVMDRYLERQVVVQDSPYCGAMTWASAQPDRLLCQRELALRYWHHRVPTAAR
jgi:competence protein ComEC